MRFARLPRSIRRMRRPVALGLLVALGALLIAPLLVSASPPARQARRAPADRVTKCLTMLDGMKRELTYIENLLKRTEKRELFLIPGGVPGYSAPMPVERSEARDILYLELLAGHINARAFVVALRELAKQTGAGIRILTASIAEDKRAIHSKEEECQSLKRQASATPTTPPSNTAPTTPPSSAGDLEQDGPITVTLSSLSPGYKVDDSGARSLNGRLTLNTPIGKATYTWDVPSRIPRSGVQATLDLSAEPGSAGESSNLNADLFLTGEVDETCTAGTDCTHISAYTKGGNTATANTEVTIKARPYSEGRTLPVLVTLGTGFCTITIPYRIIQ